ncbi:ABC transporter permease [Aliikangiella maris]
MLGYYFRLAFNSLKRNPVLSSLMIMAIGLGIGASMTTITVTYMMGTNPIPAKSEQLFYVQLDSWDPERPASEPNEPPDQITYIDGMNLMRDKKAFRQTLNSTVSEVIQPEGDDIKPFDAMGRTSFADFFTMFDVPFLYGNGWNESDDNNRELVTVLSKATNEKVFGGKNSVGQYIKIGPLQLRIVGVLNDWHPVPKFYDVTTGAFNEPEDFYIPYNLGIEYELSRAGNTNCWKSPEGDTFKEFINSECVFSQMWVELPTLSDKQDYLDYLTNYVNQQKSLGRFERPLNNQVRNVMEWMENQQVVSDQSKVITSLALMFLVVCLLNTVGLLLSKFLGKSAEIGLRRALGASRNELFRQHLIESSIIGLGGGLLGLFLAWCGLQGIAALWGDQIGQLADMDWVMVISAVVLAIFTTIIAALYPTWRACSIAPASQLKVQ